MAALRSLAAAVVLAAGSVISQGPAYGCDERIPGSCKPEPMLESGGEKAEAATAKKATKGRASKESWRQSRRASRRASVRHRSARARSDRRIVAQSGRSKRDEPSPARRASPRDDGASVRRVTDDIETVGQASVQEPEEMASRGLQAAPILGTTLAPKTRPSATLPMPAKPLDANAGSLVTAPPSTSAAPVLPASPVQAAAPRSPAAFAAGSTLAQAQAQTAQAQTASAQPAAAAKAEESSGLSPLRVGFLAFAGVLTLGTVLRMVFG